MFPRIRHTLLITLFALAHLIAQPLTTSAWCQGMDGSASECSNLANCSCCSMEPGSGGGGGCCSMKGEDEGDPGSPEEDSVESACNCTVNPPAPLPQCPSDPVLTELNAGAALQRIDENPTLYSVWPSLSTRAARAPNPPPPVVSKTCPVFTQVFRL